jgi:hypothetical protein
MARRRVSRVLALSLLGCALLATLLLSEAARADNGEVGATGGSVYPIWTTDIRMAAETVQATCFGSFAEYRVDFQFFNEGKARIVKLGFPFIDVVVSEYALRPVGFQAWQDGRQLTVTSVPANWGRSRLRTGYYVYDARFPHGSTMITVSYLSQPSVIGMPFRVRGNPGDLSGELSGTYDYWLHTGSTWAGTIGKAVVRYQLADSFLGYDIEVPKRDLVQHVEATTPSGWTKPQPRTYQWTFTDFEPTPAKSSDWWKTVSPYDVSLAYGERAPGRASTPAWTWSTVAAGFGSSDYNCLQDGYLESCWAEGAPGLGIGQWVQARLKRPTRLRELRILPGNNSSDTSFGRFARPRTLRAVFSDGSSVLLRLADAPTLQRFPVDVTTTSVRLVIQSAYRGTDYPGTCISEVELGTERAPGYAPFWRLIADSQATGGLPAWAGRATPVPRMKPGSADKSAMQEAQSYTPGALLGVSIGDASQGVSSFPADDAPFKEPASLAAIEKKDPELRLPDQTIVGKPVAVTALSYWTCEIRYSSGIDVLIDTRLPEGAPSLSAVRAQESRDLGPYTDGRKHAFELASLGGQLVGLARAGRIYSDQEQIDQRVAAQLFWRQGDRSYHLYARSEAVGVGQLVRVARSMLGLQTLGSPASPSGSGTQASGRSSWLWVVGAAVGAAVIASIALLMWRKKRQPASGPAT